LIFQFLKDFNCIIQICPLVDGCSAMLIHSLVSA
jgi:hypothetical protein